MAGQSAPADFISKLVARSARQAQDLRSKYYKIDDPARDVLSKLSTSLSRIKDWEEKWSVCIDHPDIATSNVLGDHGSVVVQEMLQKIFKEINNVTSALYKYFSHHKEQFKPERKGAIKKLLSDPKAPTPAERAEAVKNSTFNLTLLVSELCIYSEAVFVCVNGSTALDLEPAKKEKGLGLALECRIAAITLWKLSKSQPEEIYLELDPLSRKEGWGLKFGEKPGFYIPLLIEASDTEIPTLRKRHVDYVDETDVDREDWEEIFDPEESDYQLFRGRIEQVNFRVPRANLRVPHFLQVHRLSPKTIKLIMKPTSLADILRQPFVESTDKEGEPQFRSGIWPRTGSKIELAFELVESGLFFIGTPWFSRLGSNDIRRYYNTETKDHHYMLRAPYKNSRDLFLGNTGALSETRQLFRLGILLMEIAFGIPDVSPLYADEELENSSTRMANLALVEETMGPQYAAAMAFCLLYRKNGSMDSGKYDDEDGRSWSDSSMKFLKEYYSEVYLR